MSRAVFISFTSCNNLWTFVKNRQYDCENIFGASYYVDIIIIIFLALLLQIGVPEFPPKQTSRAL